MRKQLPNATIAVGIALVTVRYPDGDTHYFDLPPEGMDIVRKADFQEDITPTVFALTPSK
jgi:hypothetical protein